MNKTAKQIKHLFNIGVVILFIGFIFAGAVLRIGFILKIASLL